MYGYSTHKYIIPKGTPGYRHRTKFLGCRVHKTKKNKTKTQQNTICFGHNFMQTNTNNGNKTMLPPINNRTLRQTEHCFYAEIIMDTKTRSSECKDA